MPNNKHTSLQLVMFGYHRLLRIPISNYAFTIGTIFHFLVHYDVEYLSYNVHPM